MAKVVEAPTLPATLITPVVPAFRLNDWVFAAAPLIVLVNEILFPLAETPVVANVTDEPRVTAPV